jgi:BMFP domain-containing protein YqiC
LHRFGRSSWEPCTVSVHSKGASPSDTLALMIDPKNVEQVFNDLRSRLPGGFGREFEKNLRAGLNAALGKLDLVTREELEIQNAVLARTRAKLEALEKQVAELENLLRK